MAGLLKEELQISSVNARRTLVQAVCREIEGLVSLRSALPPPTRPPCPTTWPTDPVRTRRGAGCDGSCSL